MSWVRETKDSRSWVQRLCARILKTGPIPHHVAFIMDGNRRFATKNSLERAQGHLMGFDKLAQTLEWCRDLGIREVTVYAFSIENFKRSSEEVDGLMELARTKFERLLQERELLDKHGVCIRVLGNVQLLPRHIQELIAEAVHTTRHNDKAVLNVCFAYTSRNEICIAMSEVADGVRLGLIKESDISESVLEKCLYTNKSHSPDLLVRTSGEVRLSDFLLWQSAYSVLSFMEVLWPEFSIWHLYAGILHYQRHCLTVKAARKVSEAEQERLCRQSDYECVMEDIAAEEKLNGRAGCEHRTSVQDRLEDYARERQQRIDSFVAYVTNSRDKYFEDLCTENRNRRTVETVSTTT